MHGRSSPIRVPLLAVLALLLLPGPAAAQRSDRICEAKPASPQCQRAQDREGARDEGSDACAAAKADLAAAKASVREAKAAKKAAAKAVGRAKGAAKTAAKAALRSAKADVKAAKREKKAAKTAKRAAC